MKFVNLMLLNLFIVSSFYLEAMDPGNREEVEACDLFDANENLNIPDTFVDSSDLGISDLGINYNGDARVHSAYNSKSGQFLLLTLLKRSYKLEKYSAEQKIRILAEIKRLLEYAKQDGYANIAKKAEDFIYIQEHNLYQNQGVNNASHRRLFQY